MGKLEVLRQFWAFMREYRKFWLAPVVIVLLLAGLLMVTTQGSALAPFVYSFF